MESLVVQVRDSETSCNAFELVLRSEEMSWCVAISAKLDMNVDRVDHSRKRADAIQSYESSSDGVRVTSSPRLDCRASLFAGKFQVFWQLGR